MLLRWAKERPNEVYLKQIINRQFVEFTYAEVADKALRLVSALRTLGAEPGDKVALISKLCGMVYLRFSHDARGLHLCADLPERRP